MTILICTNMFTESYRLSGLTRVYILIAQQVDMDLLLFFYSEGWTERPSHISRQSNCREWAIVYTLWKDWLCYSQHLSLTTVLELKLATVKVQYSTLYIGMDEVLSHYACTFENSDLHFHFQ